MSHSNDFVVGPGVLFQEYLDSLLHINVGINHPPFLDGFSSYRIVPIIFVQIIGVCFFRVAVAMLVADWVL